jgi:hypothetical protein
MGKIAQIPLRDFIKSNKDEILNGLNDVMQTSFKGLEDPTAYAEIVKKMAAFKRRPLPRQARLIAASEQHLRSKNSIVLSAECGCGKTQVGACLAHLLNAKRVGIMCPSHLVSKWAQEIKMIYSEGKDAIRPYKIVVIDKCGGWSSLDYYRNMKVKKGESLIFIFSYSVAKLGYRSRRVAVRKTIWQKVEKVNKDGYKVLVNVKAATLCCPDCGKALCDANVNSDVIEFIDLLHLPRKCEHCGTILRQPEEGEKRLSLAEYAGRRLPRGWFDLLIVDEIHELKGGDTGQGNAFGTLASRAKKVVGLTGTLLNGYAESVFYLLYRLNPVLMKNQLGLDYSEVERFIDLYGARETSWKGDKIDVNVEGIVTKKRGTARVKNLPRINPLLLTQLLSLSIFLRLDEMNISLPPYREIVVRVKPDSAVLPAFNSYIWELIRLIRSKTSDGVKKLGALASDSLSILDLPNKPRGDEIAEYVPEVARTEAELAMSKTAKSLLPITNKEKRLVEIVREELSVERKCLVYITFSQLGTTEAVEKVLKEALPHAVIRVLPDSVEASKRESWLQKNDCDVLITNPEKVKTGLDLLQYPTILFFQPTYKVYTLKQAARRSWRIGQDKEVKVYFLVYERTPQEKALQLIARKLAAAGSIEGRIGDGGLGDQADDDNENIALALAKSILAKEKIEDFQMEEIALGLREWDEFEKYFISVCEEFDRLKPKAKAIAPVALDILAAAVTDSLAPLSDTPLSLDNDKAQAVKEEKVNKAVVEQTTIAKPSIDTASEVRKITVYRVIRKGKQRIEQPLRLTLDQIDELVGDDETSACASFQMAFDF